MDLNLFLELRLSTNISSLYHLSSPDELPLNFDLYSVDIVSQNVPQLSAIQHRDIFKMELERIIPYAQDGDPSQDDVRFVWAMFRKSRSQIYHNIDISTDIENGYHDSEGDIIYLESLLVDDTIPNLPLGVFLDHDPENLKDEPDNEDLKSMVKVFDPEIHEKTFSPTYVKLPFEDHHYLYLTYVIRIFLPYFTYLVDSSLPLSSGNPFIEIPSGESKVHIEVLLVLCGNRLPIPDGSLPLSRSGNRFVWGFCLVTDIAQKDKNKAKRTKPSTGMEKAWKTKAKGVPVFILCHAGDLKLNYWLMGHGIDQGLILMDSRSRAMNGCKGSILKT
ncbi:hypothetical protein Tco_0925049 [Tanacetum coccineum]|uniref:Uncharacterized protein n=1 Tax=Tanacetum coccineum TaxID=301880 RepID=A0ABQ5D705_9ASTR